MISPMSTQEIVAYVEKLFYDYSMEACPLQQNDQLEMGKVEENISDHISEAIINYRERSRHLVPGRS